MVYKSGVMRTAGIVPRALRQAEVVGVETVRLGTRELDEIGVVVSVGSLDEGCEISCSA
jgi:hypothetical protein